MGHMLPGSAGCRIQFEALRGIAPRNPLQLEAHSSAPGAKHLPGRRTYRESLLSGAKPKSAASYSSDALGEYIVHAWGTDQQALCRHSAVQVR
jgi:hypothetical protein